MNESDNPMPPWHDSQNTPPPGERIRNRDELPDYEEEHASPLPAVSKGLSKPRNWIRLFSCFLLLLGLFLAAPLYHSLKSRRADFLLGNSSAAFAYGDSEQGVNLLKQAVAIAPGSESVGRAVELFNARAGDAASLQKLLARMSAGESSDDELLGIAELEAKSGKSQSVAEVLARLPKDLRNHQLLRLTLVQAMLKGSEQGYPQAAAVCLSGAQAMRGENAARLRTQAAIYLLSDKNGDRKKEGVELLLGVMREKTGVSLAAARILARIALYSDKKEGALLPLPEAIEVAHLLPTLTGHQSGDELLASDLAIHADPSCEDDLIKRMVASYQNAPRHAMLDFARWLNTKGLHDQVIAFAGTERPRSDTDWLLIVLDAESAKGDWGRISDMLDTPAGLGIPNAVKHLFLARVAMVSGDTTMAEDEWRSVSGSLHLEKPETLAYIAGYEEEIGAFNQAAKTYREMADRKETHISGLIGLIRSQPRSTDAGTLIPLYEELLAASPNFADATGDLAYLKLLKNQDIPAASGTAETLLIAQPNSLARISTAALGRLRKGDFRGAFSLYEGNHIDWMTAPDPWKAVCVAVLRASGNVADADRLAGSIVPANLNPQEKEFLLYPLPAPTVK